MGPGLFPPARFARGRRRGDANPCALVGQRHLAIAGPQMRLPGDGGRIYSDSALMVFMCVDARMFQST